MQLYILDSNFFIQAHRSYYPIDVAKGFWDKVKELSQANKIISIDKVKEEIYQNKDELTKWCKNNLPRDFFKNTSYLVNTEYPRLVEWAKSKKEHYSEEAIKEFLHHEVADAFLIAYCLEDPVNRILVTQEKSEPSKRNKIKIPDVCKDFKTKNMDTLEMFRNLKETF